MGKPCGARDDVFDEVTRRDPGKRARRIVAFAVATGAVQALAVAAAVMLYVKIARPGSHPAAVDVTFVRRAADAEKGVPGASRAHAATPSPPRPNKPPARRVAAAPTVAAAPSPSPIGLAGMRPPDLDGARGQGPAPARSLASGGEATGSAGEMPAGGLDDAPRDPGSGFSKPREVNPGCVRKSIRVPRDLAGFVSGPIEVKFAVGRDGAAALVQVVTPVADPRIADAIRAAVTGCEWKPGSDAQGRPVRLWVVLPVRFRAG